MIHSECSRRWISRSDGFRNEVLQRSDYIFPLQVRCSLPQAGFNNPGKESKIRNVKFLRCVTASASMTQQLLTGRAFRLRPFRVTNADRSLKKGIMAYSLGDLINKVQWRCKVPSGWIGVFLLHLDDRKTVSSTDFIHITSDSLALARACSDLSLITTY